MSSTHMYSVNCQGRKESRKYSHLTIWNQRILIYLLKKLIKPTNRLSEQLLIRLLVVKRLIWASQFRRRAGCKPVLLSVFWCSEKRTWEMRGDTHASLFDLCSVGVSSLLFVKQTPCSSFLPGATSAPKSLTRDWGFYSSPLSLQRDLAFNPLSGTQRLN